MPDQSERPCLEGEYIREDDVPINPEGPLTHVKIFRTQFKDRYLARWNPEPNDPAEEPIWAVATNLLVTLKPGIDPDEANGIFQEILGAVSFVSFNLPLPDLYLLQSPMVIGDDPASYPLAKLDRCRRHSAVRRASPDFLFFSFSYQRSRYENTINPPEVEDELLQMGAPEAWKITQGSKCVRVAVLDTGIDLDHPDLVDNIAKDDQGQPIGYNFYANDPHAGDDHFHGTYCAGLIGAQSGIGVNPLVSLLSIKFLGSSGCGRTSDAIRGIDFALKHDAFVISNSWGGTGDSEELKLKIAEAEAKGVLFVAGAGNGQRNLDQPPHYFPAAFELSNVISVGGCDDYDNPVMRWGYGSRRVHLCAPGTGVYSTLWDDDYGELDGTSAATAFVSGAAALVKSANLGWSYWQVKERLLTHTIEITNGFDASCSGGRLDLANAVLARNPRTIRCRY